jgi:hypothetical protein
MCPEFFQTEMFSLKELYSVFRVPSMMDGNKCVAAAID